MKSTSLGESTVFKIRELPLPDFELIRKLVYERCGIHLTAEKRDMMASRLNNYLHQKGYSSFIEYYKALKRDVSGKEVSMLVNLISTNYTYFFREKEHFQVLKKQVLPRITSLLRAKRDRDLRIWCAGASSGEEPYSLIISLKEYFLDDYSSWDAGLLATDISDQALDIARKGIYHKEKIAPIPDLSKSLYLNYLRNDLWQIKPEIRKEITFRRFNLMDRPFPFNKPFHIIFCRNVMIYFDPKTRKELVGMFYHYTAPGGFLFIGQSEGLGERSPYQYVQPSVYHRKN